MIPTLIILAIVAIAIVYILSIWIYKRAPANMGFIRTGFGGTRVCLGRGALVLPVFHEVTWISLETIKLVATRAREQAVLTSDKIRVDVTAELYAHVGHTEEDLLVAARSLGEKTFDAERVRSLLEAKVVSAIRSYAATKTLTELHENRDAFAQDVKSNVTASFKANGLTLEEVTIASMEQTGKEYFKTDNVFDAEGLKIITEITSNAKREVHNTEKRTAVSIRQKDLDTQLELLEIEKQEAFARASQDREVANEQALQIGQKQVYVLDQRMAVERKEIDNEKDLERMRTERDLAIIEEARKRETSEIEKGLQLEQAKRDREIALIAKAKEEELADVQRKLAREQAEKDREITLIEKQKEQEVANIARELAKEQAAKDSEISLMSKERERQQADIMRQTAVLTEEERARDERHQVAEATALTIRKRGLETHLEMLELDKQDTIAGAIQEQTVASEQARILSQKQRDLLERRFEVEQEEINQALAVERARIAKDISVIEETKKREVADVQRQLTREAEEKDRQITLEGKAEELESAEIRRRLARDSRERESEIALVAKAEELERAKLRQNLVVELESRDRDIAVIAKEQERERADIQRFLAREQEERDRQIAVAEKTSELELAEVKRLQSTVQRERAEHQADSVKLLADANRQKELERIAAEADAESTHITEQNKADVTRMHMLAQAEARKAASEREADATLTRARASSEAQQISAIGIEKEAAARGRAQAEVDALQVVNAQAQLEAEAVGIQAKAQALRQYDDVASFLELSRLHIEAERDIHIDQAKAMGNALNNAQIRMYGGEGGTVDTIRGLFTSGFGLGEALEGVAQSLPDGLRQRFANNGLRGIFGTPELPTQLRLSVDRLDRLVDEAGDAKTLPFPQALAALESNAQGDATMSESIALLRQVNQNGLFNDVPFERVWEMVQGAINKSDT